MNRVKIDAALYERAKKAADKAGYENFEEFLTYVLEKELNRLESSPDDTRAVEEQLRGLGYIE